MRSVLNITLCCGKRSSETYDEDTAYNLGQSSSILKAICRRMRRVKTGGFLWCPGVERALEVTVRDVRAQMDVLRRFDIPIQMKVALC
jgi:hypothetical protein